MFNLNSSDLASPSYEVFQAYSRCWSHYQLPSLKTFPSSNALWSGFVSATSMRNSSAFFMSSKKIPWLRTRVALALVGSVLMGIVKSSLNLTWTCIGVCGTFYALQPSFTHKLREIYSLLGIVFLVILVSSMVSYFYASLLFLDVWMVIVQRPLLLFLPVLPLFPMPEVCSLLRHRANNFWAVCQWGCDCFSICIWSFGWR